MFGLSLILSLAFVVSVNEAAVVNLSETPLVESAVTPEFAVSVKEAVVVSVTEGTLAESADAGVAADEVFEVVHAGSALRRRKQVVFHEELNRVHEIPRFKTHSADEEESHALLPPGMNPLIVHYGEEAMLARDGEPIMLLGLIGYSIAAVIGQYHGAMYLYELFNYYFGSG